MRSFWRGTVASAGLLSLLAAYSGALQAQTGESKSPMLPPAATAPPSAPSSATPQPAERVSEGVDKDVQRRNAAPATPPRDVTPVQSMPASTATPPTPPPTLPSASPPPQAEQTVLQRPRWPNSARLVGDNATVKLSGIVGLDGEPADGLQSYIARAGNRVACQVVTPPDHVCLLPDGTDVAMIALVNGAARTADDAPEPYREQERLAQSNRRGIWASLPPAPLSVQRPIVQNTATLFSNGQTFVLFGLRPVDGPYAAQMQAFLNETGGKLRCEAQLGPAGYDTYVCLLPDGTDFAKFILANGAARVGPEAPDAYRELQGSAIEQRRGIWASMDPAAIQTSIAESVPLDAEMYSYIPSEEADGIIYVAGAPAMIVDGATVFLNYVADIGWGYWGYWEGGPRWYGAPGFYAGRLNHWYPGGRGLRATWAGHRFHAGLNGRYGLAPGGHGRAFAGAGGFNRAGFHGAGLHGGSSWAGHRAGGGAQSFRGAGGGQGQFRNNAGAANAAHGRQFSGGGGNQFRGNGGGGGNNRFVAPSQRGAPSQHFTPNFRSGGGGHAGGFGGGGHGGGFGGGGHGGGFSGGGGHGGGGHGGGWAWRRWGAPPLGIRYSERSHLICDYNGNIDIPQPMRYNFPTTSRKWGQRMARSYAVGTHFEAFVEAQVKSGRYASASEVLREGLRLLEDRDQRRLSRHYGERPASSVPARGNGRSVKVELDPIEDREVEDRLAHLERRWRQGAAGTAD